MTKEEEYKKFLAMEIEFKELEPLPYRPLLFTPSVKLSINMERYLDRIDKIKKAHSKK